MRKMLIRDVIVWIDSLTLKEGQSIDDLAKVLHENFDIAYPVKYEVTYEETLDD